jgi:hypothetical protein
MSAGLAVPLADGIGPLSIVLAVLFQAGLVLLIGFAVVLMAVLGGWLLRGWRGRRPRL